jgi:hypothetical protein
MKQATRRSTPRPESIPLPNTAECNQADTPFIHSGSIDYRIIIHSLDSLRKGGEQFLCVKETRARETEGS